METKEEVGNKLTKDFKIANTIALETSKALFWDATSHVFKSLARTSGEILGLVLIADYENLICETEILYGELLKKIEGEAKKDKIKCPHSNALLSACFYRLTEYVNESELHSLILHMARWYSENTDIEWIKESFRFNKKYYSLEEQKISNNREFAISIRYIINNLKEKGLEKII